MGCLIFLFLLAALVFAGAGVAFHYLWIASVVFFLCWIAGFAFGRGKTRGFRRSRRDW
jgi:hypothetical protein